MGQTHILADVVPNEARTRLISWHLLKIVGAQEIFTRLAQPPLPPRPTTWERTAALWTFLRGHEIYPYNSFRQLGGVALVPVKGADRLYPVASVVILPHASTALDDADLSLLERRARIVDPEWLRFLNAGTDGPPTLAQGQARGLLRSLGLDRESSLQSAFEEASKEIFALQDPGEDGVRLTWLAARADLRVPKSFRYQCLDGRWHSVSEQLLAALSTDVEDLLPPSWAKPRILAEHYSAGLDHRRTTQWRQWLASDKSQVSTFALPTALPPRNLMRFEASSFIMQRGGVSAGEFHWKHSCLRVFDYDFPEVMWAHWRGLAATEPYIWARLVRAIAPEWPRLAAESTAVIQGRVYEQRNGSNSTYLFATFTPAWLQELQSLPCLLNTFSRPCLPTEILWKSPDTEPLLGIEHLLHDDFNREQHRKFMQLLGVRERPDRIDIIVGRLRTLAQLAQPPFDHLLSLYRTLDQIAPRLPTDQLEELRAAFKSERLTLAHDGTWQRAEAIYQINDEDIPGAPLIHHTVSGLSLWDRVGVPRRPTIELALEWMQTLPRNQRVDPSDLKRLRPLLRREPARIIEECQAWIDLADYWTPIDKLSYRSSGRFGSPKIFPDTMHRIADTSMLAGGQELIGALASLPPAESQLVARVSRLQKIGDETQSPWLRALACGLYYAKIQPDDPGEAADSANFPQRAAACQLYQTGWQATSVLEVTPYLDEGPVGPPYAPRACWEGTHLYIRGGSAGYHRELVEAIGSRFASSKLREAVRDCVSRDTGFIDGYFQENFRLAPGQTLSGLDGATRAAEAQAHSELKPAIQAESGGPDENQESRITQGLANTDDPGTGRDAEDNHPPGSKANGKDSTDGAANTSRTGGRGQKDRRPDLIRAIATKLGYRWGPSYGYFVSGDGAIIRRDGELFPWTSYDARGSVSKRIWVTTETLRDGINLPGEVWQAMEANRDTYWLVAPGVGTEVNTYEWSDIAQAISAEQLELSAAAFRLREAGRATSIQEASTSNPLDGEPRTNGKASALQGHSSPENPEVEDPPAGKPTEESSWPGTAKIERSEVKGEGEDPGSEGPSRPRRWLKGWNIFRFRRGTTDE